MFPQVRPAPPRTTPALGHSLYYRTNDGHFTSGRGTERRSHFAGSASADPTRPSALCLLHVNRRPVVPGRVVKGGDDRDGLAAFGAAGFSVLALVPARED